MQDLLDQVKRYLGILRKRRQLTLAVTIIATTAALFFVFTIPPKYEADSTVFIEQNVINNLVEGIAITPEANSKIRVLRYAMLSRAMMEKVLQKMDPLLVPVGAQENQDYITGLIARTRIKIQKQDLFKVSIEDRNPKFAQDYINTLVSSYLEENIRQNREEAYGANRFLDEQVALFKKKLDVAEDKIIRFRKEHGVYVAVQENELLNEIRTLNEQLEQLDLEQRSIKAKAEQIGKELQRVRPTVSIVSNSSVEARVVQLQQQLQQLLTSYTEDYPEVIRIRAELESLKNHKAGPSTIGQSSFSAANPIHQELTQQKLELEGDLSALESKKLSIEQMIKSREQDLRFVPENRKQLALLEQDKASLQNVYEELLVRVSQAEMSKQMEIGNKATTFRVVDYALLPSKPSSPNVPLLLLVALFGGLGAGIAVAILREMLDVTIKEVGDLPVGDIPVIGHVSHVPLESEIEKQKQLGLYMWSIAGVYYLLALSLSLYFAFIK